jgi:hypothetical protein
MKHPRDFDTLINSIHIFHLWPPFRFEFKLVVSQNYPNEVSTILPNSIADRFFGTSSVASVASVASMITSRSPQPPNRRRFLGFLPAAPIPATHIHARSSQSTHPHPHPKKRGPMNITNCHDWALRVGTDHRVGVDFDEFVARSDRLSWLALRCSSERDPGERERGRGGGHVLFYLSTVRNSRNTSSVATDKSSTYILSLVSRH